MSMPFKEFLCPVEPLYFSDEKSTTVFIDLQKTFDTINHSILLKKMEHYGVRGIALDWFTSYLSDRKKYASVNGYTSDYLNISCGVPQGSVLGPHK